MAAAKFSVSDQDPTGQFVSPAGFCFGVTNWNWGIIVPTSITWYTDNTAGVFDHWGRPIRGVVTSDGKEVRFAPNPPEDGQTDEARRTPRPFSTHMATIAALESEGIDWRKLPQAGWPQATIDVLRSLPNLPDCPVSQLHQIKSETLRKDALLRRLELDQATDERKKREQAQAEREYEETAARVKADKVAATTPANGTTQTAAPAATSKKR